MFIGEYRGINVDVHGIFMSDLGGSVEACSHPNVDVHGIFMSAL
jgi:hypothetical protein